MRITDAMIASSVTRELGRARERSFRAQNQASSGVRVARASDDPAAAAAIARADARRAAIAQHRENIGRVQGQADLADSALGSMADALLRARALAVRMANGTYGAADRKTAAAEAAAIRKELIALGNSRAGDVYIFAGRKTGAPPFDATGTYKGDRTRRRVPVGPARTQEVGVTGDEALRQADGRSAFDVLAALETALKGNDVAAIRGATTAIDAAHQRVVAARATVGIQVTQLKAQDAALRDRDLAVQKDRARLAEVDSITSLSEMVLAQTNLRSAIEVSSRVLREMSLVDRL